MGFLKKLLDGFVSAEEPQSSKSPGRNDPCWCGSGNKYKKCHLEEDQKKQSKNLGIGCGTT